MSDERKPKKAAPLSTQHSLLLTLTTDFGEASPYVAAMKGVILRLTPDVRLIDLSHSIPPQDVAHAAFFLKECAPYFPAGTLHVVVVDPGVGTDRALLYVEVQRQRLLVPDNGVWAGLIGNDPPKVIRLAERQYWCPTVSLTFHGRDILASVAGHLAGGLDPRLLGPEVHEWMCWQEPAPALGDTELAGQVVFVDHFGNLITNIPGQAFLRLAKKPVQVRVGTRRVARHVRCYGDAARGTLAALVSSSDLLEIAVVNGNAARRLHAKVGTPVRVARR